ncbi:hypothetical protein A6J49_12985 [Neisseria meningitidis]|nr:hypothetical protein A6J49_12985 [Neisseria meningitidis]
MPWKGAGNISTCRATLNARFAAQRDKTLPPFQTASKRMRRNGFKNLKIYISLQKKTYLIIAIVLAMSVSQTH